VECFREDDVLETIKLLVGYGYDLLEANSSGKPLYIAAERAHISVAQHLISLGIQLPPDMLLVTLKLWDSRLTTLIGVKAPMVRFLVENGADVHVRTEAGDSVLHIALQSFYEDDALGIAELLVGYGCDPLEANSSGKSSLHIAIEQVHISVAQYLLSLGVPLPPDILVTLNSRGIWRTARIVRFLVENGADVHACAETGDSVFHAAFNSFQHEDEALELAKLLVGYGCDPLEANCLGKMPLHIAIEQAHMSVVQYIFSLGIPLPPDLLLVALNSPELAIGTKMSMVSLLIHSGVDVHVHAETGDSVFHIVLESFNEDDAFGIAELLISYGCDPLEPNSSGKTPLHIAIEQARTSVVQYLISLGVPLPPDILLTLSPHGRWKTAEMICFLIENGADVSARNQVGDSVLHVVLESLDGSSWHAAREIVDLLVAYGCDPFEANSSGKPPLLIAIERRLSLVERYLLSLDPDVGVWH
jgi:ankyrin repeat protein